MWGFPILLSTTQMILMCCIFKHNSPNELKQNGKLDELKVLMGKLYDECDIDARIA